MSIEQKIAEIKIATVELIEDNKRLALWNENQKETIKGYMRENRLFKDVIKDTRNEIHSVKIAYAELMNAHEALKKENLDQDLKAQIVEMQKRDVIQRFQIANQSQTIEDYQEQVDRLRQIINVWIDQK